MINVFLLSRTPKIEVAPGDLGLETVKKSVYTVTTPASYVFFEQTITPAVNNHHSDQSRLIRKNKPRRKPENTNKSGQNFEEKLKDFKKKQKLKQESKIERNSISFSSENLVGGRIAENANEDHYYPNREPYFPGHSNSYRPGHGALPPIIPPPGISYSPPTSSYQPGLPPTSSYQPGPPPTSSYLPPTSIITSTVHPGFFQSTPAPVYNPSPILPNNNHISHHHHHDHHDHHTSTHSYTPANFIHSDIFFKPVKKRPHKRHQKKHFRPNHSNNVSPETIFHFVEENAEIPLRTTTKRFPSETSSSLDVNRPRGSRQGIVSLLKAEDLTVMAALLEETRLDESIDKQGHC